MALTLPEQISAAVRRSRHILITFPKIFTLDAVAAATAVALVLRQAGKVFDVVADGYPAAAPFPFLPALEVRSGLAAIQQLLVTVRLGHAELEQFSYDVQGDQLTIYLTPKNGTLAADAVSAKPGEFRYDLILTLNAADLPALGSIFADQRELFERTPIINIDHQPGNEHYGQINAVDLTAAATTEIIYELIPALRATDPGGSAVIEREVATALLAGLIGGTKSFRDGRVTAKTLRTASALVEAGGNRDGIVKALYHSHSITALKLWGKTLARLQTDQNGKLVWASVPEADFLDAGATLEDLPGLTDALLSYLPAAEVAVLLAQRGGDVTVRLASLRNLSARELARPFDAPGDQRVVSWLIAGQNMPDAERQVIAAVRENLQTLLP